METNQANSAKPNGFFFLVCEPLAHHSLPSRMSDLKFRGLRRWMISLLTHRSIILYSPRRALAIGNGATQDDSAIDLGQTASFATSHTHEFIHIPTSTNSERLRAIEYIGYALGDTASNLIFQNLHHFSPFLLSGRLGYSKQSIGCGYRWLSVSSAPLPIRSWV